MARKVLKESEKASTHLSDIFMGDTVLMDNFRDLALKVESRHPISGTGTFGITAIRDTCDVLLLLAHEADVDRNAERLRQLEERLARAEGQ